MPAHDGTLLVVCTALFLLLFVSAQVLIHRQRRRDQAHQQGIGWQIEKAHRFANGWRPTLWNADDPTVTDDQKAAALQAYASGKPIPPSGVEARR